MNAESGIACAVARVLFPPSSTMVDADATRPVSMAQSPIAAVQLTRFLVTTVLQE